MQVGYYDTYTTTTEDSEVMSVWEAMARIHPLAAVHWDRDGLQFPGRPSIVRRWDGACPNYPKMIGVVVVLDADLGRWPSGIMWIMFRRDLTWHLQGV